MAATNRTPKAKTALLTRPSEGIGISQGMTIFIVLSIVATALYAFVGAKAQTYSMTEPIPWAILGSTCGLFSAACIGLFFIAITVSVFGSRSMTAFVNRTLFLSIASACATVAIVLIHYAVTGGATSSPWNSLVAQIFAMDVVGHVVSADSTSNVWWIRTLMAGAFSTMLIMFWANSTGRTMLASIIGGFGGILALGATMSLGAAITESGLILHPVWYGAGQMGLYLIFSSVMVGAATLILLTHLSHVVHGSAGISAETRRSTDLMARVLLYSTYAVLVATAWRYYSILGGTDTGSARVTADVLIKGLLSANFWVVEIPLGLVIPVLLLSHARGKNLSVMSIAAIMVITGALFQRYDMLLAGRITPEAVQLHNLALTFSYLPSVSELLLVISGIGLVGTILLVGEWLFGSDFRYSIN